jgi:hypothetical protein
MRLGPMLAGLALAASSSAADVHHYSARIADASGKKDIVADGVRWRCQSNACTATVPGPISSVAACAALAREVGRITAFGDSKHKLSAKQLAACNRAVAASTQPSPGRSIGMQPRPSPLQPSNQVSMQLSRKLALRTSAFDDLARKRTAVARPLPGSGIRPPGAIGGDDCDDTRRDVHPNAPEICDYRDNNCDGFVDEGATELRYLDADGDGHGDPARSVQVCPIEITGTNRLAQETGSPWLVEIGNDCDDRDPDRWRGC